MRKEAHVHVHVHVHQDDRLDELLRLVRQQGATLREVRHTEEIQMADLSALTAEVEENADVVASAVVLIGGLAQQIRDLATDPDALAALADELDSSTNALSAAVAAGTPAAPTEEPTTDEG